MRYKEINSADEYHYEQYSITKPDQCVASYRVAFCFYEDEFGIQIRSVAYPNHDKNFSPGSGDNQLAIIGTKGEHGDIETVRFGPQNNILIRDKGIGVGSILIKALLQTFNKHRHKFADAKVIPVKLSASDASSPQYAPNNLVRRSRFYEKLGLTVSIDEAGEGMATIDSLTNLPLDVYLNDHISLAK